MSVLLRIPQRVPSLSISPNHDELRFCGELIGFIPGGTL